MNFSKLIILGCLIKSNMNNGDPDHTGGGAICFMNASPVLTKCKISNNISNTGGAVICWDNASPVISDNIITYNSAIDGAGIYIGSSSNPQVINNIIINNRASDNGGGIRCFANSRPILVNNTIANNKAVYGGGLDCRDNCDPMIFNTIIYGNSADNGNQVYIDDADSDPAFCYCDIEGGKDEFKGIGAGNSYNGIYTKNIENDPLFADTAHGNFNMMNNSPCFSHGADSIEINGSWYYVPFFDMEGNPRPNPSGIAPDVGATMRRK